MKPHPALLLLLAAVAGCRDGKPAVTSCADPLSGVWRTEDGRRYQLVENRTGIEIFAMFDTTTPPEGDKPSSPVVYAPVVFDLRRPKRPSDVGLSGRRTQRMTKAGRVCKVRTKAQINDCAKNEIVLRYQRPGELDWETCKATPTDDWVELTLYRR